MKKTKTTTFVAAVLLIAAYNLVSAQSITVPSPVIGSAPLMTITFQNAPPQPGGWVGIFPYTAGNYEYLGWLYMDGLTSGSLVFNVPDTNGIYDFRMFAGDGAILCRSEPFIVKKSLRADQSFNGSGSYHSDFSGLNLDDKAVSVKTDPFQRIVVAGYAFSGDTSTLLTPIVNFFVARFLPDGQPDPTFGANGRVVTPIPGIEAESVADMVIQPDGKIIVGGNGLQYGVGPCVWTGSFILVRYDVNGSLDNMFGTGGIAFINFTWFNETAGNSNDVLTTLALQPDGKILAGGYGYLCQQQVRRSNIARFHANGVIDSTFGLHGKFTHNIQNVNEWILDISAPEPGGDGSFYAVAAETEWLIFIANRNRIYKFNANGTLASGFGTDGVIVDPRPGLGGSQVAREITLGPDGKLYLMGSTAGVGLIWFMKKDPVTGADDLAFGTSGLVVFDHPEGVVPVGLEFYNDFMVTGHHTFPGIWSASRFTLSGEYDYSFGWPKMEVNDWNDEPLAMTLTSDGKMVMAGSGIFSPESQRDGMVVKFDTNSTMFLQNSIYSNNQPGCLSSNESIYARNEAITSTGSLSLNATKNVRIFSDFSVSSGGYLSVKIHPGGFFCTKEAPMTSIIYNESTVKPEYKKADQLVSKLVIYPNPTEGRCRVSFPIKDSISDTYMLAVVNKTGKVVREMRGTAVGEAEVDLDGLPSGIYLIKLNDGMNCMTGKVIKRD